MIRQDGRKMLLLLAFTIFPLFKPLLSPVTVVMGLLQGIIVGGLALYLALFVSSLFVGRLFCGWLCPAGGLQECCALIVRKSPGMPRLRLIKYACWTILVVALVLAAIVAGGVNAIDLLYQTRLNIPETTEYLIYYAGVIPLALLALTLGKRSGCQYLCWLSPFMIVGTKIKELLRYPSLHLRSDEAKCIDCGLCSQRCPMSIDVVGRIGSGYISNAECIMCGECVDACPKHAISYSFSSPRKP